MRVHAFGFLAPFSPSEARGNINIQSGIMGNEFTPEQVDNAANVQAIIAVVKEEIGCLKVSALKR